MRYSEPDHPPAEFTSSSEERLRRENEELRRQLQQFRGSSHTSVDAPTKLWRPSKVTIVALGLILVVILVIAFFAGYVPQHNRTALIADEARDREQALPRVAV